MDGLFLQHMAAKRGNVPSLDGLRAISILIVLSAHFISSKEFPGGLGVYVFFVISGFLITRLLTVEYNTTHTISLRLFYLRRILRLYPVIIAFTCCVIGLAIALKRPFNLLEPASGLGYFANYLYVYMEANDVPSHLPFGVFWSLSIEEHFYILFPIVFVLLKGDPRRLLWAISGLCVACLGLRIVVAGLHPEYLNTLTFYTESQYRLDSIAFGVILALACQLDGGRRFVKLLARPPAFAAGVGVLLACLLVRDPWFRETFRYSLIGCAIDVLIAGILFGSWAHYVQWVLNTAILVWIGRLSYSLYIWHEGILSFMPEPSMSYWSSVATKLAVTVMVAATSYYVVEQPFLQLRRYLRSSSSAPLVLQPSR